MYVEAICPLCFASHVVPDDMRGETLRCEECEEEFVVSKKAKRTNKKPSRLREVKAADEAEEVTPVAAAEVAEVLPEAKLADKPPKKKSRAEDEEVQEIPDDAVQGGAPVVKTTPAAKRRRDEDEEEDRPKKRRRADDDDEDDRPRKRPAAGSGVAVGLIVGLSAGAVFLFGLCGVGAWFAFSGKDEDKPQAQVNNPPANNGKPPKAVENPPPPKNDPPRGMAPLPPKNDPPKKDPPKVDPPKVDPPKADPPAVWTVKADPPAAAVKMPAAFKKEIPAPRVLPEITFPSGPSPFVAVGANRAAGDERQVWDLQTGEMTGKVVGAIASSQHPVLGADGAHLAIQPSAKPGTVDVWALGPGKVVSIDLGGALGPTDLLDFAGPGFLLTGRRFPDKTTFTLYDVATGKREREFNAAVVRSSLPDSVAVSPGGAYVALADRDNLWVYDLKTGAPAGERPVPKGNGARLLTCHGLSFSPDGGELAGLFYAGVATPHVICWDLARGEVVADVTFPQGRPQAATLAVYRGHAIDWVGDRRGWLLHGYTLVDRNKNGSATFLPQPPGIGSPVPRHLIGPGHTVTLAPAAKPGEKVLTVSTFDPDKPQ